MRVSINLHSISSSFSISGTPVTESPSFTDTDSANRPDEQTETVRDETYTLKNVLLVFSGT